MAIKPFRKINSSSWDVEQVQSNVAASLDPLAKIPFLDGALVKAVTLASGSNRIAHPLQRKPQGWVVTDRNGTATIYRTAWDSRTISLTASASVTIDMWIF